MVDLSDIDTPGWSQALRALRVRAGYSQRELADLMGLNLSTYVSHEQRDRRRPFRLDFIVPLAKVLAGRGNPPIRQEEVMELGGIIAPATGFTVLSGKDVELAVRNPPYSRQPPVLPDRETMPRDVPVFGTAAGADGTRGAFVMNTGGAVDWVRRPPGLMGKAGVYSLYIENESMSPRFEPGDLVYIDPNRPPQIGSDVVIERRIDSTTTEAFVKRLVRRTPDVVYFKQFNPEGPFDIPRSEIVRMDRILTLAEMLGV